MINPKYLSVNPKRTGLFLKHQSWGRGGRIPPPPMPKIRINVALCMKLGGVIVKPKIYKKKSKKSY